MSANDRQEGGDHYKKMSIQPWEAMEAWATDEQFSGYLLLSAIAYLARVNSDGVGKGGKVDVQKAIHFLEKWVEVVDKPEVDEQKAIHYLEEWVEVDDKPEADTDAAPAKTGDIVRPTAGLATTIAGVPPHMRVYLGPTSPMGVL